ncbi:MAG: TolC family protein [Cyanobacteria bacterium J06626_4]
MSPVLPPVRHRLWVEIGCLALPCACVLIPGFLLPSPAIANEAASETAPVFSPLPGEGDPSTQTTPAPAAVPSRDAASPTDEPLQEDATLIPGRSRIALTLPELLTLVVTGNRDLRDRQLQRLVEQQQLQAAEAAFDPRFTPAVGIGVSQSFDAGLRGGGNLPGGIGGTETELGDRTTLTQSAGVEGTLTTRQGTAIGLTLDALGDTPIGLRLTQPLLRGAGTAVNEAPVDIARLRESQNFLALEQTLIDTVSTTVNQYTTLIETQESVRIQAQALERRQERLRILTALVEAGRRAEFDLVDSRRSVADAERDLLLAQTQREQANTDLLDQIGTEQNLVFVAAAATITDLFASAVARIEGYDLETLVAIAYQTRPDYRQIELDQEVAQLNQRLAADGLQWQLNLEGNANLGDFSETTLGVVARRTFDEPELETALVQSQVEILQQGNRLAQERTSIRNEITNQLNTVNANLARVEAAQRATENARLQLEVTQELFRRGRIQNVFQITNQEENLVDAENSELTARIQFLDSIVTLDQAVGLTLDTWSQAVNFLPALLTPESVEEFAPRSPELDELEAIPAEPSEL